MATTSIAIIILILVDICIIYNVLMMQEQLDRLVEMNQVKIDAIIKQLKRIWEVENNDKRTSD